MMAYVDMLAHVLKYPLAGCSSSELSLVQMLNVLACMSCIVFIGYDRRRDWNALGES